MDYHHPATDTLWNLCRSLSRETGVLYFDGEQFATYFEDTGRYKIYQAVRALTEKGWFKLLVPRTRTKTGVWAASQYKVLSAEEWAGQHPHLCRLRQASLARRPAVVFARTGVAQPKRAGHKAWGQERVQSEFHESNNLHSAVRSGRFPGTDSTYRRPSISPEDSGSAFGWE